MPEDRPSRGPARDLDKIMVRLPDGMRDRLSDAAKANNRSVNAEVVVRLEESFKRENFALGVQSLPEFRSALEGAVSTLTSLLQRPGAVEELLAFETQTKDEAKISKGEG